MCAIIDSVSSHMSFCGFLSLPPSLDCTAKKKKKKLVLEIAIPWKDHTLSSFYLVPVAWHAGIN